jgi:hypothetical protein
MNPTCFVLTPFSEPFNSYYRDILVPTIKEAGYEPVRGDEIYGTSSVMEDVFSGIREAAVLVADVTGKNPNVNYELGIAHALRRPVVIISQSDADIPFDYRHLRVIIYDARQQDWATDFRARIIKTLERIKSTSHLPPNVSSLKGEVDMLISIQDTHKVFYQVPFKRVPNLITKTNGTVYIKLVEQGADGFVIKAFSNGHLIMRWSAEGELLD